MDNRPPCGGKYPSGIAVVVVMTSSLFWKRLWRKFKNLCCKRILEKAHI